MLYVQIIHVSAAIQSGEPRFGDTCPTGYGGKQFMDTIDFFK